MELGTLCVVTSKPAEFIGYCTQDATNPKQLDCVCVWVCVGVCVGVRVTQSGTCSTYSPNFRQ